MIKNFLALAFLSTIINVAAQEKVTLTLDEAINYAIEHQPSFQNYKIDQDIASARRLESTSRYLPKLNGNYDMRDNLKLAQIVLKFPNPVTNVEEERTIQQGTKYAATAGVDLNQPLLDMSAVSDIKYSRKQQLLTGIQLQAAIIDLKINVSRSYFLVLLNQERVSKAAKSVARFQRAYDDTKVRFDNQNAVKTELNRAFLNLSNAKFQLKTASDSVKTSVANLNMLIGLPSDAQVELKDSLRIPSEVVALPEYPDYKGAEANRVELKAESMQGSLYKLQLQKINFQYIPTLNGYGYIGGQGLDNSNLFRRAGWYWNSYIGVRLNIPIFDGLQKAALANQQKLLLKKNENNLAAIRSNISYQLQIAAANYSNASTSLQLIGENVKLAEEVVDDVNVRYTNSLATYQEVLDAENTLKETEFNYLQSLYAYLIAELEWKKANGKL